MTARSPSYLAPTPAPAVRAACARCSGTDRRTRRSGSTPSSAPARWTDCTSSTSDAGPPISSATCTAATSTPSHYTGLEAQPWLARAARRRRYPNCSIVEADFVKEPGPLFVGADVVVFSGSLNLLTSRQFYRSVRDGWEAAGQWLAFNFLCTSDLTGARYLVWHRRAAVLALARRLGAVTAMDDTYEDGDCLVVMRKPGSGGDGASLAGRARAIQSP